MEDLADSADRGEHGTEGLERWYALPPEVRRSLLEHARDGEHEGRTLGAIVAEAVQSALALSYVAAVGDLPTFIREAVTAQEPAEQNRLSWLLDEAFEIEKQLIWERLR
jgi:hypothetical protein